MEQNLFYLLSFKFISIFLYLFICAIFFTIVESGEESFFILFYGFYF